MMNMNNIEQVKHDKKRSKAYATVAKENDHIAVMPLVKIVNQDKHKGHYHIHGAIFYKCGIMRRNKEIYSIIEIEHPKAHDGTENGAYYLGRYTRRFHKENKRNDQEYESKNNKEYCCECRN